MNRLYIFIYLILLSGHLLRAQEAGLKGIAASYSDSLNKAVPKEKIYLHLDKSVYAVTDTLWFKAYLINPATNAYSNQSGVIHVEILSDNGTIIQSLSLPVNLGISWGSFAFNTKDYVSGQYTIRAYTQWIRNFGDTFFFTKTIRIVALNEPSNALKNTTKPAVSSSKASPGTENLKKQDPSVQFLPEGGTWIANRLQKTGFKAIAPNGLGIQVQGEIKDSKLNTVATFASNQKGMGYFELFAEPGEVYTAYMKIGGKDYNQVIQGIKPTGTSLFVRNDFNTDSLTITVITDLSNQPLTLTGQSRGMICFSANLPADTRRRTLKIPKKLFSSGVAQITLQNQAQVLNERRVFIRHPDQLHLTLNSSAESYGLRDSISMALHAADEQLNPIGGSFSVAVTDDAQVAKNLSTEQNILSYFLLTSDLKGEIEEPYTYFEENNRQKHEDLEALCLTQGWVSYRFYLGAASKYAVEKEYTISGKITNIAGKPAAHAKVSIFGRSKTMMFGDTITNEKGEFIFKDLPVLDSALFVLKVLNTKGQLGTLGFEVNEFKPATVKKAALRPDSQQTAVDSITLNFVATRQEELKTKPGNGIALKEVNIVGKKIIKGSKNLNGPGEADQTITAEEIAKEGKKTLLQILFDNVKGFTEGFRRETLIKDYFLSFNEIRFIFDGIPFWGTDYDNEVLIETPPEQYNNDTKSIDDKHFRQINALLRYYTAEDIEGIEVMRHIGNATRYKIRFEPYVQIIKETSYIEITTKGGTGPFLKKSPNTYLVKPPDYGDNRVFYSPKYTIVNRNDKTRDLRSTLYWQPNLVTNLKGEAQFSFFSADRKGTYTVWVEGSDMQGKFGVKTFKITIK